ncbi:MAG: HigA family addiction module antitoxin [Tissierellia bacterium]|nr:HigA family addiction module antitoxin [Tissierellia bacterium]MDD4779521.1 HigA family addiction module antitoxin [Tissierellia bacterium]
MNKIEYKDLIGFHPGYYVKDIINDLNISQIDFAKRLQVSGKTVSMLLSGDISISDDLAIKLSKMTGTSISVWMNLQNTYDQKKAEIDKLRLEEEDITIISLIDYTFFTSLNLVSNTTNKAGRVKELCKFLNISSLKVLTEDDFLVNYRVGVNSLEDKNIINSRAWVQTAIKLGSAIETSKFDCKLLKSYLPEIRSMTLKDPNEFLPRLIDIFSKCGVSFVLLPHLKNSGINGAVKWINPEKVILAMNNRRMYADTFWFSLFHEIKHVLQQKIKTIFINSSKKQDILKMDYALEEEADLFAQDFLIPQDEYKNFIYENFRFSEKIIQKFANDIGIHPGIVVGRLQRDKYIGYDRYNSLKEKYIIGI